MNATHVASTLWRTGILTPPRPSTAIGMIRSGTAVPSGLGRMVRLSAARWPMRVALRDDNGPLTYRALVDSADDAARALADVHRIGPGSRVGVMCRNSRDFVIALLASARLGADVVLLNTDFRGAALDAAATQQRLSLVIAAAEFADIVSATGVPVADPGMRSVHGALPSVPREGRLVLLTSGTTGNPRGVPRDPDIGALLGMVTTVLARTRLRCGMRTMIAVPMFHAFGLAVLGLTLSFSGTAVMRERFDPVATIDLCRRHEAHALMVVPAMLARILDADLPADAKTPPVVLSGGSALSPITAARFTERFGDVLYNGYGSSEVALATLATPDDLRTRPGTVGKPIEGVRIAVIGDDGRPVPTGATGRVFAGGASAVDEYVGGARKDTVAGLVSTGDLGRLDGDGRLHVIGREDDMIVSGGENVYPQALENALAAHDGIVDACAFGVADDRFGQRLTALVVSRGSLTSDDVIDHLSTRVSRYERPREIRFVDEIPRNAAGKVDRAAVRRLVGEEAR